MIHRTYVFEVWVEKARILGNLDMAQAISSLLQLVFCFNLKYPKVFCHHHPTTQIQNNTKNCLFFSSQDAETVCDFLQREVANYGNDEGNILFINALINAFG